MKRHALRLIAFFILAGVYLSVLNARPDFTRYNADDFESYLALADSLVHGRGYTRSLTPGDYVPHTTWPPGLPVLLMPAMALSGDRVNFAYVKITMALVGLLGVFLTWVYVRRWTGQDRSADLVALFLATNATYWDFSHQAMCEMPLVVYMLASLLVVDIVWAKRHVRWSSAFFAGLFSGFGMMIKGHAFGLGLIPLAYLIGPRGALDSRQRQFFLWIVYGLGMIVPFVGWSVRCAQHPASGFDGINQMEMLQWRDPNDGSKGKRTTEESIAAIKKNVTERAIYHIPSFTLPGMWSPQTWAFPRSGYAALPLSIVLLVFAFRKWKSTLAIHLALWPMTLLNLFIPFGGSLRYWVSFGGIFGVLLATTLMMVISDARRNRWYAFTIVLLSGNLSAYIVWHEQNPYSPFGPYREMAELFEEVARRPIETRGVRTENPHTFQLMTGHVATGKQLKPDHAVIRIDGTEPIPPGSLQIVTVYPLALIKLPPDFQR